MGKINNVTIEAITTTKKQTFYLRNVGFKFKDSCFIDTKGKLIHMSDVRMTITLLEVGHFKK